MKTINRIFLFGDSWIEGQGTYESITSDGRYLEPDLPLAPNESGSINEWRKQNSWNKFIKEITNCNVENYAVQGSSNYAQFGHIEGIANTLTKTDLVIIGFTSKLRDREGIRYSFDMMNRNNIFVSQPSPLNQVVGWEKLSIDDFNFGFNEHHLNNYSFNSFNEKNFTEKFIQDYFISLHNDMVYEHIAQTNYYFLQERFKSLGFNLICFDLFEQYLNPIHVDENLNIDENVYINYGKKTMNEYLIEYEIKNIKDSDIGIWEWGIHRPDLNGKIVHPNQHGIKIYVDYLFKEFLPNHYKFQPN